MANVFLYQLTDVWTGGATFNGISLDVTDTSSASASSLLTLKKDGLNKFAVRKDGTLILGDTAANGFMIDPQGTLANTSAVFTNLAETEYAPINVKGVRTGTLNALTASDPAIWANQTWNNGAVSFMGIQLNITDTASAGTSMLMELKVNNVQAFSVFKGGWMSFGLAGSTRINFQPWDTEHANIYNDAVTEFGYFSMSRLDAKRNNAITASDPAITVAQTWNNAGVAFVGITGDFTNTASAYGSQLVDLKVSGTSAFKVRKDGTLTLGSSNTQGAGIYPGNNRIEFYKWSQTDYATVMARDFFTTWANARTTDVQALMVEDGWDNVAVNFTAFKMNITNTNSGSGSKLMDLQVGGVSKFSVSKSGYATMPSGASFGNTLQMGSGQLISWGTGYMWANSSVVHASELSVDNIVASTSTTTGSLTVAGGLGVAGKINAADVAVTGTLTAPNIREKLTADRTYYVRTDGSNSSAGLANTSGGAWATLQYALEWIIANLDINGKTVQIQLNDGTHAGAQVLDKEPLGAGWIWIHGNSSTPTNVVIEGGGGAGLELRNGGSTGYYLGDVKIQSTDYAPIISWGNHIRLGNPDYSGVVHFGPCVSWAYCMYSMGLGAYIEDFSGNHVVTHGTMAGLIQATDGGRVLMYYPHLDVPVTWGTAAVEAWADYTSVVWWPHAATAANATGLKYSVSDYKIVGDAGDKFPGTLPGVVNNASREKLNADRTYYVRTDGNDNNNGKANSVGGAWLTPKHALEWISEHIDLNGKIAKVQLADGTYPGFYVINRDFVGGGGVWIEGNPTTPGNVIIYNASLAALELMTGNTTTVYVSNLKLDAPGYSPLVVRGVQVNLGTPSYTGSVTFGRTASTSFVMMCYAGGYIQDASGLQKFDADTSINPTKGLVYASGGGTKVDLYSPTFINSPMAWGQAGVEAWNGAVVTYYAGTGTATGVKYRTDNPTSIPNGATIPGSLAGVVTTSTREKLLVDRTYYVRTNGNNSNNGLADTAGGAWATLQRAFDYIADNIELSGAIITIQLETGVTHVGGNSQGKTIIGKGAIFISGSATNNTDTIISRSDDNGLALGGNPQITWYVGGVKLESSYYLPLYVRNVPVQLGSPNGTVPAPRFGAAGLSFAALMQIDGPLAYITTYSAGITIDTGGMAPGYFVQAGNGAVVSFGPVAFAATTTFNNSFVEAYSNATITVNSADGVAGSAVGKRYNAITGGQIRRTSGTGGIDNLPGTVAGTWTDALKTLTNTVNVSNTTASTSSTTGALTVAGGLGVAGDIFTSSTKVSSSQGSLTFEQTGATYGPSRLRLSNGVGENGATFDTTGASVDLVDFIFKTNGGQDNMRYERRTASFGGIGNSLFEFQFGGASVSNTWSLFVGDASIKSNMKHFFNMSPSVTPGNNNEMVIEATSNTTLTIKYKGTDGVVRSVALTLT